MDDKKSAATFPGAEANEAPAGIVAATPTTAAAAAADAVSLSPGAATSPGEVSPDALPLPQISPFGTALAIEAELTIQVADVREAVIALPDLVAKRNGAIFDTDIAVGQPETATATITVKVQPQDLESLIAGLAGLGEVTDRTQRTEDVADQIADTESRIQTAQASVDRVRILLDEAATLNDVVRIENELTIRETVLEQLLASQRNLTDRVQLATLTIVITPAPVDQAAAPVAKRNSTGVADALGKGWEKFTSALHGTVVALAYGAPFLVIALLVGIVAWWVRRRTPRRVQPASPAGDPA